MSKRSRWIRALPTVMAAGVLAACATANPGDAAVIGSTTIPQATIGEQLRAVNEVVGAPPDTPSADGATALVYGNVVVALVEQTAVKFGADVPEAQVDEYYDQQVQAAGGDEALREALAQQGVAPQLVRGFIRATLLQQSIADRIAPDGDQQSQGEALRAAVTQVADEVGVSVAPRYGEWDSETLQIVDPGDPVAAPADVGVGIPAPTPPQ